MVANRNLEIFDGAVTMSITQDDANDSPPAQRILSKPSNRFTSSGLVVSRLCCIRFTTCPMLASRVFSHNSRSIYGVPQSDIF